MTRSNRKKTVCLNHVGLVSSEGSDTGQFGVRYSEYSVFSAVFVILSVFVDSLIPQWIPIVFVESLFIICLLFLVSAVLSILLDFCTKQSCVKLDSAVLKLCNNACKGSCNVIVCFVPD